jgi:hypothetical protein
MGRTTGETTRKRGEGGKAAAAAPEFEALRAQIAQCAWELREQRLRIGEYEAQLTARTTAQAAMASDRAWQEFRGTVR